MSTDTKPENPPAFPQLWAHMPQGMTLRDYFAGQALLGLVARFDTNASARIAYAVADAMLKERSKS